MKVWLLMYSYDDGQTYESMAYDHLSKIVDSEEKAKTWIFESAVQHCKDRLAVLNDRAKGMVLIDDDGPYLEPWPENDPIYQDLLDEIYFFENQLNSLKEGEELYTIKDFNGYESHTYSFDILEVE